MTSGGHDVSGEPIRLYPFSYFDLMRRKWARARYRARLDDIASRYGCFRIDGAPEIRERGTGMFQPPTGGNHGHL